MVALLGLVLTAVSHPEVVGTLLVALSVLVFAWAVVGLLQPNWGRIPNRVTAVWIWALSGGLLIAGSALVVPPPRDVGESDAPASVPSDATRETVAIVDAETWLGEWPLTIDGGILVCRSISSLLGMQQAVYIMADDGRLWPLNSFADMHAERFSAEPELEPIWRVDEAMLSELRRAMPDAESYPVGRVNIGGLIDRGLSLCPTGLITAPEGVDAALPGMESAAAGDPGSVDFRDEIMTHGHSPTPATWRSRGSATCAASTSRRRPR